MPEPRRVIAGKSAWAIYYPERDTLCTRVYRTRRELIAAYGAYWRTRSWRVDRKAGKVRAVEVAVTVVAYIEEATP